MPGGQRFGGGGPGRGAHGTRGLCGRQLPRPVAISSPNGKGFRMENRWKNMGKQGEIHENTWKMHENRGLEPSFVEVLPSSRAPAWSREAAR